MKAMLCEPLVDLEILSRLLQDDDWGVQQKVDGHRTVVVGLPQGIQAFNRNGELRALSPNALHALRNWQGNFTLDGELMDDGTYIPFDLLTRGDRDLRQRPFLERHQELHALISVQPHSPNVHPLRLELTTLDKVALLGGVRAIHGEGIVLKRLNSRYVQGRSPLWRKFKLVKTADCIVMRLRPDGKDSLEVGLHDGTRVLPVTKVKVAPNVLPTTSVGDIVEVRYLAFTPGGRLREPVFLRFRTDKTLADCSFDQVKTASKQIL